MKLRSAAAAGVVPKGTRSTTRRTLLCCTAPLGNSSNRRFRQERRCQQQNTRSSSSLRLGRSFPGQTKGQACQPRAEDADEARARARNTHKRWWCTVKTRRYRGACEARGSSVGVEVPLSSVLASWAKRALLLRSDASRSRIATAGAQEAVRPPPVDCRLFVLSSRAAVCHTVLVRKKDAVDCFPRLLGIFSSCAFGRLILFFGNPARGRGRVGGVSLGRFVEPRDGPIKVEIFDGGKKRLVRAGARHRGERHGYQPGYDNGDQHEVAPGERRGSHLGSVSAAGGYELR